jgi:hypothetical protein
MKKQPFINLQLQQNRKTTLHQYSSLPRERNLTGCSLPRERATLVGKKKSEKRLKDENGGLPSISLHLSVDFGPKRARILNFGALF